MYWWYLFIITVLLLLITKKKKIWNRNRFLFFFCSSFKWKINVFRYLFSIVAHLALVISHSLFVYRIYPMRINLNSFLFSLRTCTSFDSWKKEIAFYRNYRMGFFNVISEKKKFFLSSFSLIRYQQPATTVPNCNYTNDDNEVNELTGFIFLLRRCRLLRCQFRFSSFFFFHFVCASTTTKIVFFDGSFCVRFVFSRENKWHI